MVLALAVAVALTTDVVAGFGLSFFSAAAAGTASAVVAASS